MKDWHARRPNQEGPNFLADVEALGGDMLWLWELVRPNIEYVLCGVSRERLDEQYPADEFGLRQVLTDWSMGFPPARIAFVLEETDGSAEGVIVYLAVTPRQQAG